MTGSHGVARDQLRAFIERIERLTEEKKTIEDDIKDVYGEAKGFGYDVKIMKKVVALRKKDDQERIEEDMVLDTYLSALGMIQGDFFEDEDQPEPAAPTRKPAMALQSPHQAAEAVTERTATQSVAKASGEQTEGTTGLQAAGPRREMRVGEAPALVPATSDDGRDSVERHAPISPETADEMDREEMRDGRAVNSLPAENARKAVPETEDGSVTHAGAGESPATEIAPASQGEAEATSVEPVNPLSRSGSADANTGGRHVTAHPSAAPHQAGALVKPAPATPGQIVFEHTPPVPMHRFAFAHCWPELTKAEYEALGAEISNDPCGVIEPIVRKGDVILDGWARYNIARSFGDEYPVIEYDGEDELLDVIRWQRAARNWSTEQERKIASALAKEVPHRASEIMSVFEIEGEVA